MIIYIAGKIGEDTAPLIEFAAELESRGHIVVEKWWEEGRLPRPYCDYPEENTPAADRMLSAAFDCDVYILFPTEDVRGAIGELGAAEISRRFNSHKQVIIVNPYGLKNQSVFYMHSIAIRVRDLDGIRALAWY